MNSLKSLLIPNPYHQLYFHMVMSGIWFVSMLVVPFFHWFNIPELLIMEISLYANFATEFGAIPASQANARLAQPFKG